MDHLDFLEHEESRIDRPAHRNHHQLGQLDGGGEAACAGERAWKKEFLVEVLMLTVFTHLNLVSLAVFYV